MMMADSGAKQKVQDLDGVRLAHDRRRPVVVRGRGGRDGPRREADPEELRGLGRRDGGFSSFCSVLFALLFVMMMMIWVGWALLRRGVVVYC